ncbi:MAG: sigma-70 family RNA polymerase sigma factor [Phycisphaeraceae bacterium]|nr:sigma-70 family RNA polymerase sigma factor [Phycisphaeraceae bacterium]
MLPGEPPNPLGDDARELALVRAIRSGDRARWGELLSRYQDRLYAVCFRTLGGGNRAQQHAADLCHDAMVKIMQGLDSFDGSSKLSTWMIRVAMNTCLSWLRAQKHRAHASLDAPHQTGEGYSDSGRVSSVLDSLPAGEPSAASNVERTEQRRRVARALEGLDPEQRAILVLRDLQGLEYDQIAEVLGTPVGTVKSRLFRARAALRAAVETLERPAARPDPA